MLSIFFIGVALSMDAFSLALSIGTLNINKNKEILIPVFVGIMHFIMSLIGVFLGTTVLNIININAKILIIIILLYIAIIMYIDRNNEKKIHLTSYLSIIILSFGVSIDSFSVGLGLSGLTNNYIISSLIFLLCSACITYIGIIIGKYSIKVLKKKSSLLGIIILLILVIVNICQLIFN